MSIRDNPYGDSSRIRTNEQPKILFNQNGQKNATTTSTAVHAVNMYANAPCNSTIPI